MRWLGTNSPAAPGTPCGLPTAHDAAAPVACCCRVSLPAVTIEKVGVVPTLFRKAFHVVGDDDLRRVSFADSLQVF